MAEKTFQSYGDLLAVLQKMTPKQLAQPVVYVEPYDKDVATMTLDTIMPIEAARLKDLEEGHGLKAGDLVICC